MDKFELDDIDAPGPESGLAIAKVHTPQATEWLVKTQFLDFRPTGFEGQAPLSQGPRVIETEGEIGRASCRERVS
jgi:hypothetical protein